MTQLAGQVALVTGASRGFGRAIAEQLAASGVAVVATGRSSSALGEVVDGIRGRGGTALAVAGDVTVADDVARVVDAACAELGAPTLLVHSAGLGGPIGPVWVVDPAEWWYAQEVHVRGAQLYIRHVVPRMIERGGGRVILISSIAGTRVTPHLSGYDVAKAAQINLVAHLAAEAAASSVFAFAIEPGTVITDLAETTMRSEEARRWAPRFVAFLEGVKRTGDPERGLRQCAERCAELASGRWDVLSGRFLTPSDDLGKLAATATETRAP